MWRSSAAFEFPAGRLAHLLADTVPTHVTPFLAPSFHASVNSSRLSFTTPLPAGSASVNSVRSWSSKIITYRRSTLVFTMRPILSSWTHRSECSSNGSPSSFIGLLKNNPLASPSR